MFTCSECGKEIPDAVQYEPPDLTMRVSGVARQCPCGWTCCFRCDPTYDQEENGHNCPQCGQFRSRFVRWDPHRAQVDPSGWISVDGEPARWLRGGLHDQWKKDRQSDRWVAIRRALAIRLGLSKGFAEHAAKAKTWEQLAAAFISTELSKDQPDFARLLDAATGFPATKQHGIWISVAEKCRERKRPALARYAYAEAVVVYPTSSSVVWYWLHQLMKDIKNTDVDKLLIAMKDHDLAGARPGLPGDQEAIPKLATKCKTLALKYRAHTLSKGDKTPKLAGLGTNHGLIDSKQKLSSRPARGSDFAAGLGSIAGLLIGIVLTFSGIMSLASSVILAKIGTNLIFGPGTLLCGVLFLFSVFSFRKRKNKKGGLLLIAGLLIFITTMTLSLVLEEL